VRSERLHRQEAYVAVGPLATTGSLTPDGAAYVHRFWLESTLWYAVHEHRPFPANERAYADAAIARAARGRPRRRPRFIQKNSCAARMTMYIVFTMSAVSHPTSTDPILVALADVRARRLSGDLPDVSPSARADWAYGNAVIENADVTRAMAEIAVRESGRRS
jgi:hypothetical protein